MRFTLAYFFWTFFMTKIKVNAPPITKAISQEIKAGNLELRNHFLEQYSYIISWVCAKLKHIPIDPDTIRYGATLGLIQAIATFEPKKGGFNRYAFVCCFRSAQREMTNDWLVRVPSYKMHQILAKQTLPYEMVSISEHEDFFLGRKMACNMNNKTIRTMPDELVHIDCTDNYEKRDFLNILNKTLNELKPLEKDCILYKYGLIETTLKELGDKHKVSYEWVRLNIKVAFKKLQKQFMQNIKDNNEN